MSFVNDILNIIYPSLCCSCGKALTRNEDLICFSCRNLLPKVSDVDFQNNELTNRFFGKMDVTFASSFFYYYKDGITQKILHQFKYNNYPEIGELLGKWFAYDLAENNIPDDIDLIIPVPLHPKKERKRGYNQSQYFAKGLSEVTAIPTDFETLERIQHQKSQTLKTKEQRWKNVKDAFRVLDKQNIENRHILLVDDIITTGATLEACGSQLYRNGAAQISIVTIGLSK